MKICSTCGEEKQLEDFNRDVRKEDPTIIKTALEYVSSGSVANYYG